MSQKVLTPEFRVSFPHLFQPQQSLQPGGEPKYSVVMLFPKDADLSDLKSAAANAAREKWGDSVPNGVRSPFRDQGEKSLGGYEAGAVFITASSKSKPGIVDQDVQAILDQSEVYAGCWARASVRAYAYDVNGNRGVSFGLNNLQKLRDGERLDSRTRPEDDFQPAGNGTSNTAGSMFD